MKLISNIDYRGQTAQFGMCSAFTHATMTCLWESSESVPAVATRAQHNSGARVVRFLAYR